MGSSLACRIGLELTFATRYKVAGRRAVALREFADDRCDARSSVAGQLGGGQRTFARFL